MKRSLPFLSILFLALCTASLLHADETMHASLLKLSIEELMEVRVTSVAKKEQKIADAPAAVFVITQEDIRRSGVTSIPEALRLAPGIEVARFDAETWAVTARGFNGNFASTVLVLIDGRSVYSPLFAGVEWDGQDTFLQDIDRIEVIRGPGAALWGANAVNGVINIITKRAQDTQGGLVYGGGGTEERGFGGVRYGAKTGENTYVRTFAKYFFRDGSTYRTGGDAPDSLQMARGGFRMDSELTGRDSLTFQGEIYDGRTAPIYKTLIPRLEQLIHHYQDATISGGHVMAVWKRTVSPSSDMKTQIYYDNATKRDPTYEWDKLQTIDLDFQHRFVATERQELTWGLGYRVYFDNTSTTSIPPVQFVSFDPANSRVQLFSGFIQDDVTLKQDKLHLVVGAKLEHNDYTGFETQPNIRLLWTPDRQNSLWAAVSRALRTPSRATSDLRVFQAPVTLLGNKDLKSGDVVAYEAGYRVRPVERVFFDLAAFYNVYGNIAISEATGTNIRTASNKMEGETYGAELTAAWSVLDWWKLESTYSFLRMFLHPDAGLSSADAARAVAPEGSSPENQASLRSTMDLPAATELDLWLRYVDHLPSPRVDSYTDLDARISWRPVANLELALVGQNLLDKKRSEFNNIMELQRGYYGSATWNF